MKRLTPGKLDCEKWAAEVFLKITHHKQAISASFGEILHLQSWTVDSGPECVLCSSGVLETKDHLFFDCVFAKQCWSFTHIQWDTSLPFSVNFVRARDAFSGPCFLEVLACVAWNIWKVRNDLIFNGVQASFNRWKVCCHSDGAS